MKRTKFVSATKAEQRHGASEKSQFQRSAFNNAMTFVVLRTDYVIADERKDDEDAVASPALILALASSPTVEFSDKLFISTLVRDDLSSTFDSVPKSGSFNQIAISIWNRADLTTDDACLAELLRQLNGRRIRVSRKAVPLDPSNPDGPKHKVEWFGGTRTLNQLNFDIVD